MTIVCERCGAEVFTCPILEPGVSIVVPYFELFGGLKTRLCVPCENEWHFQTSNDPKFAEYVIALASYQAAKQGGDVDEVQVWAERMLEIERLFLKRGIEFCKSRSRPQEAG